MSLEEECSKKKDQERALLTLYIHDQRTETRYRGSAAKIASQKIRNSDTIIVILKKKEYSVLNRFP